MAKEKKVKEQIMLQDTKDIKVISDADATLAGVELIRNMVSRDSYFKLETEKNKEIEALSTELKVVSTNLEKKGIAYKNLEANYASLVTEKTELIRKITELSQKQPQISELNTQIEELKKRLNLNQQRLSESFTSQDLANYLNEAVSAFNNAMDQNDENIRYSISAMEVDLKAQVVKQNDKLGFITTNSDGEAALSDIKIQIAATPR